MTLHQQHIIEHVEETALSHLLEHAVLQCSL